MTRITNPKQKNAVSVLMDIFEMSNMREPVEGEVDSMLQIIGTHGSHIEDAVVYEDEEVQFVHTKNMFFDVKSFS